MFIVFVYLVACVVRGGVCVRGTRRARVRRDPLVGDIFDNLGLKRTPDSY